MPVGIGYAPLVVQEYRGDAFVDVWGYAWGELTPLPTLDLRFGKVNLQLHALDLVSSLFDGEVVAGVDLYVEAARSPLPGHGNIVLQPGLQLDSGSISDQFYVQALPAARAGVEVGAARGGVGVYAVPDLGFAYWQGATAAVFGGALGFAVWY